MFFIIGMVLFALAAVSWIYVKLFGLMCVVQDIAGGVTGTRTMDLNYILCQLGSNTGIIVPLATFFLAKGLLGRWDIALAIAIIIGLVMAFVI